MTIKESLPPHYEFAAPTLTFDQAYGLALENNGKVYSTPNGSPFIIKASEVTKGVHKGERVIKFENPFTGYSNPSYYCCWKHRTNCNATHIDCYTEIYTKCGTFF